MRRNLFFPILLFSLFVSNYASANEKRDLAIIYIATGKYISFFDNFYKKMEKYFIPKSSKNYFVFTDDLDKNFPSNVVSVYQPHLDFPGPTLKRFHYIYSQKDKLKEYKYICFLNANMEPLREINEKILPNSKEKMMFTMHPAYYGANSLNLPYDRNIKSSAFIPNGDGIYYLMGGFFCGQSKDFLDMSNELRKHIDEDDKNKVIALWHDESHLNKWVWDLYLRDDKPKILSPDFGMPQEALESNLFKNIDKFKKNPYMLILDKRKYGGHKFLREKW